MEKKKRKIEIFGLMITCALGLGFTIAQAQLGTLSTGGVLRAVGGEKFDSFKAEDLVPYDMMTYYDPAAGYRKFANFDFGVEGVDVFRMNFRACNMPTNNYEEIRIDSPTGPVVGKIFNEIIVTTAPCDTPGCEDSVFYNTRQISLSQRLYGKKDIFISDGGNTEQHTKINWIQFTKSEKGNQSKFSFAFPRRNHNTLIGPCYFNLYLTHTWDTTGSPMALVVFKILSPYKKTLPPSDLEFTRYPFQSTRRTPYPAGTYTVQALGYNKALDTLAWDTLTFKIVDRGVRRAQDTLLQVDMDTMDATYNSPSPFHTYLGWDSVNYAGYSKIDFAGGAKNFIGRYDNSDFVTTKIELRIDAPSGPLVGAMVMPEGGSGTSTIPWDQSIKGIHNLYIFSKLPTDSIGWVGSFDWFTFGGVIPSFIQSQGEKGRPLNPTVVSRHNTAGPKMQMYSISGKFLGLMQSGDKGAQPSQLILLKDGNGIKKVISLK